MPTRVLHIHVTGPTTAEDHETIVVGCNIVIGLSDASQITDSHTPEINLKTLGVYKTAIQMNAELADLVKDFVYSQHSIPTNGYAATYVSGAYGLLSIL